MNAPPAMRLSTKHLMRQSAPPLMKPSARPLTRQNMITSAQPPMNKSAPQATRQPMNSSAPHKQPIMNSARARLVLLMEAMVLPSVSKCQGKKQSKYPNKAATRYPRSIARVFQLSKQSCSLEGFPRKFAAMVDQEDTGVEVVDTMVDQEDTG